LPRLTPHLAISPPPHMATQESKDLGQLNPEEVSHVILKAHDKGMSWESEDLQVLAALLELRMPTLQFPAQSLRCAHHFGDSIDTLATRAMTCHLPEVSATNPRVHEVAGDGNCLDNATLYDLVGNWRDAFSWRVRKGLHFLQNVAWYTRSSWHQPTRLGSRTSSTNSPNKKNFQTCLRKVLQKSCR